jgi:glycosyltransferase involved in cell wall biosynthesis
VPAASRMRDVMEPAEHEPADRDPGRLAGLNVLHLIPNARGRGAQIFARALVDELGGPANGHHLVCLFEGHSDIAVDGSLGLGGSAGSTSGLRPAVLAHLWRYLHRTKPDVIVAHGGDAYKYVALSSRAPLIYCAIGTLPASARRGARQLWWRALVKRARVIAAVSDEVAAECRTVLGARSGRLVVVPNGRDAQRYRPAPQPRPEGQPTGSVTLLYVGHLNFGKRPQRFIDLIQSLRQDGLAVSGRIVGDGPMMASLTGPATEVGVELLGWCGDVVEQYQQADVLVFPSAPDGEGMPGVLIEAGLCGVPVVATQVAGATTVIDQGITGLVVGVDDLAELVHVASELVRDPERRRAMGAAARVKCEREFSMSSVAARWGEVCLSASSPRRSSRQRNLAAAVTGA